MHLPVVKSYENFVNEFPERTNINIVGIRPLRGVGCWIVDPGVVYIAIDNMFGGEGRLPPKLGLREYTATELRIIRRLVDALLSEYEKAWKAVYEIKFDFMRQETNFGFAKITSPSEMVLHSKFTIEINGRPGDVDCAFRFGCLSRLSRSCTTICKVLRASPMSIGPISSQIKCMRRLLQPLLCLPENKCS